MGYYALSTLALSGMLTFPSAAREVIEPRIMEEAHTLHDPSVLDRYLYRPLAINACYLPLMIAPLYFMVPLLIKWMLPLYTQGIIPLQIILFGFYFLSVFYPLRGIIVAHRLQKDAALLMVLCVLINVGFSLIALKAGFGIIGVSVANSAGYAALLFLMASMLRWRQGIHFPLKKIWPVLAAFPLLCVGIWTSQTWLEPLLGDGFVGAVVQSALLFGAGLALVTLAEYKTALLKGISPLSIFRAIARKRLKK
ncbi:MAG: polysaccharide biosynthesis protein [Verrucomicrobia bacterium]|nr:polysaccharide biosynthesis protein [Verrucomicrobiota bacterium]